MSAARLAIDKDLAEVIVLTGSVMAGLETNLTKQVGVPAVSGMVCAIKLARLMTDLGVRTSHVYTYCTLKKGDALLGYDDLQHVYSS